MTHPYSRPLNSKQLVENFLEFVLASDEYKDADLVDRIIFSEANLENYGKYPPTISSTANRARGYRSESERWTLRTQIVHELFTMPRLKEDNDIKLGNGGALPASEIKAERNAFIVIGLPASGKSGIANIIAEKNGAIILDSDYAKRKLPEFNNDPAGASLVHDESDAIISGFLDYEPDNFKPLSALAYSNGLNVVIPKIGHFHEKIVQQAMVLKTKYDYKVHLTLVSLVFDGYSNDPILTYYRIKTFYGDVFESLGKLSTDVNNEASPIVMDSVKNNPVHLFK